MESNFDNKIKNSLDNYELPYDSNAWDQLSKKLDVSMPVKNKPRFKSWMAASVIAVAVATAFYSTRPSETPTKNATSKLEKTELTSDNKANTSTTITDKKETAQAKVVSSKLTVICPAPKLVEEVKVETKEVQIITPRKNEVIEIKTNVVSNDARVTISPVSSLCLGEATEIKNTNSVDILIISSTDKTIVVKAKTSILLTPKTSGEYEIGYLKGDNFISKEKFNVFAGPRADFDTDSETSYNEKGLPTVSFKAIANANEYNWTFEKHAHSIDTKEAEVHYYKAGTYKITLTTTGENGCKTSETNKITVKDYNLLASNAINLSDESGKNNVFMPYALTVRNTRFILTILDPVSGETIFQTIDPSQPWDGTDKRTGNIVTGSNFIWNVVIANPQPGENANYKGVITRL